MPASMYPDAGLDFLLGQWPKGSTQNTTSYLGLHTSQTATTVITHAQNGTNVTGTSYTSYAAQALAAATWGAAAEYSTDQGRQSTYPQVTFPTVGATGATINGWFIKSANAALDANNLIVESTFSDEAAVLLATNDVIKVAPTLAYKHA